MLTYGRFIFKITLYRESNLSLRPNIGICKQFFGPTLTKDVSSLSFCLHMQYQCQPFSLKYRFRFNGGQTRYKDSIKSFEKCDPLLFFCFLLLLITIYSKNHSRMSFRHSISIYCNEYFNSVLCVIEGL